MYAGPGTDAHVARGTGGTGCHEYTHGSRVATGNTGGPGEHNDVLFNRNGARENEEQSSRAALTLHAIRETEMFAVIEAQVENKEVIEELMGRYLDEEGNPKPVRSGASPKGATEKDWKTLIA